MTGFSVTPVGPFPQATDQGFPEFIQFQSEGVDLGGPDADTVDFGAGLAATRGVGESENVVSVEPSIRFRDIYGDDMVLPSDANNGISIQASSGLVAIALEVGALLPGQSVLIVQEGDAAAEILPDSGMTLLWRSSAFLPRTAGQGATLTIIMKTADFAILCGDMAPL